MKEIHEGALFIADSHYPHHGEEFLRILERIDAQEIEIPQLFLMGDNFDLLFGHNAYIRTFSEDAVRLIQRLSEKMEVHYFEGNHDFCLKTVFPHANVYTRDEQPVRFRLGTKTVGLSHGDKYATGLGYTLYCKVLRNKGTLLLLRPFEKAIINDRMHKLAQKNICHPYEEFEKHVSKIVGHYEGVDMIIEGHFHQARTIGNYISLPSLACQGMVAQVHEESIRFIEL